MCGSSRPSSPNPPPGAVLIAGFGLVGTATRRRRTAVAA
ncbi:MAG: MYXO-CTERM sorting domain-containing protein [Sandaracinobacter sp.]